MKITIDEAEVKSVEIQDGVSKAGKEWKKAVVLLSLQENDLISVTAFGNEMSDRISREIFKGDIIKCEINLGSREYAGKYYTDVTLLDFMPLESLGKSTTKTDIENFERSARKPEPVVAGFQVKAEKPIQPTLDLGISGTDEDLPF